jgi:uncharacterized protein
MLKPTLAAALMALAAAPLWAQAPSSPAKKDLVAKIVALQQPSVENMARQLAEQSIAPLTQRAGIALQSQVPPEKREALAREIQGDLKKYGDEVVPMLTERAAKLSPGVLGPMLEEKFSEDEIKQLLGILESPVNKRFQQLGPEMGQALTAKLVAETRTLVEPKAQALQQALARRFGAQPAPAGSAPRAAAPASAAASRK